MALIHSLRCERLASNEENLMRITEEQTTEVLEFEYFDAWRVFLETRKRRL